MRLCGERLAGTRLPARCPAASAGDRILGIGRRAGSSRDQQSGMGPPSSAQCGQPAACASETRHRQGGNATLPHCMDWRMRAVRYAEAAGLRRIRILAHAPCCALRRGRTGAIARDGTFRRLRHHSFRRLPYGIADHDSGARG